ncbi:uncharacterized protein LOC119675439 [Teleopsis dalmanni]|uniref:uncharacterized protein LOC119675439 n=1 Tax=Teleopsis dalmanni TaxID=139649 RepID=UPI0018CF771D|nr:uncharacterized protein LOC119675439 [Teleopsis dalmanni]
MYPPTYSATKGIALYYLGHLQQFFEIDIQRLQRGNPAEGTLKHLNPFLDNVFGYQLVKVGGRLELSDISAGQRHPILLPKGCYFVELYVRHVHLCSYHAGAKALIALTRLNFWIINIREIARRVVHSCIHCVRYKPKLLNQMMGNLPIERLTPSRPFARIAVDFCGPILTYLRIRGRVPYKTYIAVFVCLSTKAAHLEAVSDLSTEAFIAALKRLIGRRGLPSDIYCDNATNFVGAKNKLAELKRMFFEKSDQVMLQTFCSNQFINFNFIPPRAPHFGGLWEAAVKSAKGHLYRTLSNTRFTFEELGTALIEIEAILNSRPITPHSCDPSDYEALTPAHFLIVGPLKTLSEPSPQYEAASLIDKWSRITAVKHHFWRRWSRDYLNELQIRTKWTEEQSNITEGALVLIHEDNMPPQRWLMGRIVHCIRGPDNLVRVVDVQTPKGVIRCPIHKLALLPIENPFKGGGITVSDDAICVIAGKIPVDIHAKELSRLYGRQGITPTIDQKSAERAYSFREWQQRWEQSSKGRWTYTLIPNIKEWVLRKHGEIDYNLTQILSGHGGFLEYLEQISTVR